MLKPSVCHSSQTDCVSALRKISVTAPFYLENKGKYILKEWGHADPKDTKKRERESAHTWERETPGPLALLFYVFSPPPGPALCKRGKSEVQFFLPEVLTSVLRPLFVLFFQAFPFLVFQTPPFWTPFFYSNYLTFPPSRDGRPNSLGVGVSRYLCLLPAELGQQGALGLPSCYSQAWVLIAVSI